MRKKEKPNHDISLSSNTVKTAQKENQDGGRRYANLRFQNSSPQSSEWHHGGFKNKHIIVVYSFLDVFLTDKTKSTGLIIIILILTLYWVLLWRLPGPLWM